MARVPIPTWFFALVVVRRGDQYLLVRECDKDQLWYLPAGRVEPGETLVAAAERETLEESGVPVRITGVIRVEHTPRLVGARLRVFFLAEPIDSTPPKSKPDEESLEAAWVRLRELDQYPLRDEEVRQILAYVDGGGRIYPLDLLQAEGATFPIP